MSADAWQQKTISGRRLFATGSADLSDWHILLGMTAFLSSKRDVIFHSGRAHFAYSSNGTGRERATGVFSFFGRLRGQVRAASARETKRCLASPTLHCGAVINERRKFGRDPTQRVLFSQYDNCCGAKLLSQRERKDAARVSQWNSCRSVNTSLTIKREGLFFFDEARL